MKAVWISVDAIEPPNFVIQTDEQKVSAPGGESRLTFSAPKEEWPAGRYRVDLFLQGQRVRSLPFSVQKASASGRTAGTPVARFSEGAQGAASQAPSSPSNTPRSSLPPATSSVVPGAAPPATAPTAGASSSPRVAKDSESPLMEPAAPGLFEPPAVPFPSDSTVPPGGRPPTGPPLSATLAGTFCTQAGATPEGMAQVRWSQFDGLGQFAFGSTFLGPYGDVAGGGTEGGGRFRVQGQLVLLEFLDGSQGVGAILARDESGRVSAFQFGQLVYAAGYCL